MTRKSLWMTAFAASLLASAAWPETGLIVGNAEYRSWPDLRSGDAVAGAAQDLESAGFNVSGWADATAADLADAIDGFVDQAAEQSEDGAVVLLSGRFLSSDTETWFLPVDTRDQATLSGLSRAALPLSTVLAVLADRPGHAILGLATDDARSPDPTAYLRPGIGEFAIPQGVTVLRGTPRDLADFASRTLGRSDTDILAEAVSRHDLSVTGFAPGGYAFVQEPVAVPAPADRTDTSEQEAASWNTAQQADSLQSYGDYLAAYPRGTFADRARAAIDAIGADPERSAQTAEDALDLDLDARRAIQRDLTLLEFTPRGIDGIFGPGTRAAITEWQRQNGAEATGFLTSDQIARLDGQAERRAIQLEAEAAARAEELAAQDRAFWDGTGAAGDEAGLRAYLDRYPEGLYAEQAGAALDEIRDRKRAEVAGQDTAAWDRAVQAGTPDAYRDYLRQFPDGAYVADAQSRIDAANRDAADAAGNSQYAAAENALQMNAFTLRLLEQRLAQLGLKPGTVDGTLDKDSRKAIRNYQKARDLQPTGFVNQETIVRLLADVVGN